MNLGCIGQLDVIVNESGDVFDFDMGTRANPDNLSDGAIVNLLVVIKPPAIKGEFKIHCENPLITKGSVVEILTVSFFFMQFFQFWSVRPPQ